MPSSRYDPLEEVREGADYVFTPSHPKYHEAKRCYEEERHNARSTERGWSEQLQQTYGGSARVYRLRGDGSSRLLPTKRRSAARPPATAPTLHAPWMPKFIRGALHFVSDKGVIPPSDPRHATLRAQWDASEQQRLAARRRDRTYRREPGD